MAVGRVPLIAGNWKMNLDHLQAIATVQKLGWTLQEGHHSYGADGAEVAVFPPFTDLRSVQTLVSADKLEIRYGGQDLSAHDAGAYTGEISGAFLKALDCRYVLVGHSERRQYHAESDEVCAEKVQAALRHQLVPVLCVGETAEDLATHGAAAVPVAQLRAVLATLTGEPELVVAYEPVWAIGSGQAATSEQAQSVAAALRAAIRDVLGESVATATRILYGGSVKSENIADFLKEKDIDGALIGGASLKPEDFLSIYEKAGK